MNRLVSQYLDFAEGMAERRRTMTMQEWASKLDDFLLFNEYEVLTGGGSVPAEIAKKKATSEYEKYRVIQDRAFTSDFDQLVTDVQTQQSLLKPSLDSE